MGTGLGDGAGDVGWPGVLLLADGRISELETDLIRRAIQDDGVADKEEIEFLADLNREAVSVHPSFDEFFFRIVKKVVLADGVISDSEAGWLRKLIFADNQVAPAEARFIEELKQGAKSFGEEFKRLHRDCTTLTGDGLLG